MTETMINLLWEKVSNLERKVDALESKPEEEDRDVYFVEDVARLLGVKPETVRKNYIAKGLIDVQAEKIGRRLAISRAEYLRVFNSYRKHGRIFHGVC